MADDGIKKTDAKVIELTKRVQNNYLDAYKLALENNKKLLKRFDDFTDDKLSNLTDEEKKLKRQMFLSEITRSNNLVTKLANEIAEAGYMSSEMIQGELVNMYQLNYQYGIYELKKQTGIDINFTLYNKNEIAVLMQEQQSPFTKIAFNNLGKNDIIVRRLQDAMTVSILNGESSKKIARKIKEITMMSTRQANRVIQTERNRVQSQGRQLSINEGLNKGLEIEKQWIARMIRTREWHVNLNGKIVHAAEKFQSDLGEIEFPGDPLAKPENTINCFCYIKPIVKSSSKALNKLREKYNKFDTNKTFTEYLQ